ncbi:MAG: DsbA family protein, partial [Rhodococcus sp.]|nr:DsbA family protein [Rhodococcus sp. (in: high G+C Gram-positive bacteria)]
LGGIAVVVIAVLVIGGVIWSNNRNTARNDGYGTVTNSDVEVRLADNGVVIMGLPGAPNTVDIFEDPQCKYCRDLEHQSGQELAQAIDEGVVEVRFHVLNLLDQADAADGYSTRSAAASQCVAQSGDAIVYSAFHAGLFGRDFQPAENGEGTKSDDAIVQLARDAGASDEAVACIESGERLEQARADAAVGIQEMANLGGQGTPTVLVNGQMIEPFSNTEWIADLH